MKREFMKVKPFQETEKGIQTAVLQYLKFKGWYVMRLNSGRIPIEGRLIKLGESGTPDVMAFKPAINIDGKTSDVQLYFFEIKTPKGKVTYLQEQKMKELHEYGAKCYVIRSLEEIQQIV